MIPASTNETTTTLVDLSAIAVATVDVEETHYIYARDVFGNSQDDNTDIFSLTLQHNTLDDTLVTAVVTATSTISKYEVKYTLSVSGTYTLTAML